MKKNVMLKTLSLALATVFSFSSISFAQDANLTKLVEQLQTQMSSMQQTINSQSAKINQLESGMWEGPAKEISTDEEAFQKALEKELGKTYKTFKDLKFKGDLRLRYEGRNNDDSDKTSTADRNRFRYRLRFGFDKKLHDDFKVGFRLASGGAGSIDSTNETLGDSFAQDPIGIDRAYATWTPGFLDGEVLKGFEITGGKFSNPLLKGRSSKHFWDGDVNPEGIYQTFDVAIADNEDLSMKFSPLAAQWILTETGGRGDMEMYVASGQLETKLKELGVKHKGAVNYYNVSSDFQTPDFTGLQVYNEIGFKVMKLPVKLYADWMHNLNSSASDDENAWAAGLKLGKAKKKGSWELSYAMANLSSNSVLGAFDDSDWGGAREGHVVKGAYALTDSLKFKTAVFMTNATGAGDERFLYQADLVWSW